MTCDCKQSNLLRLELDTDTRNRSVTRENGMVNSWFGGTRFEVKEMKEVNEEDESAPLWYHGRAEWASLWNQRGEENSLAPLIASGFCNGILDKTNLIRTMQQYLRQKSSGSGRNYAAGHTTWWQYSEWKGKPNKFLLENEAQLKMMVDSFDEILALICDKILENKWENCTEWLDQYNTITKLRELQNNIQYLYFEPISTSRVQYFCEDCGILVSTKLEFKVKNHINVFQHLEQHGIITENERNKLLRACTQMSDIPMINLLIAILEKAQTKIRETLQSNVEYCVKEWKEYSATIQDAMSESLDEKIERENKIKKMEEELAKLRNDR